MYAPTQEDFKHTIPPANSITPFKEGIIDRINITFRYFKREFRESEGEWCKCNLRCDLRVINLDLRNKGRYFWRCSAPEKDGRKGCGYFRVVEEF